jgi:FkbM family methyltransferase
MLGRLRRRGLGARADRSREGRKRKSAMNLLARLIVPYTRAELFETGRLMAWAGVGWQAGTKHDWKHLPPALIRGKAHRFLMKLDRSDWCQRVTYYLGRYYEFGVLRTMDHLLSRGDRFVDIGANIGMISLHARHLVGPSGRVDAFEPNPRCVEAIREHLEMNRIENVHIHPCALAEAPGSMRLSLPDEHTGTATLATVPGARQVEVEVRVGDEQITGAPRLIKIDVEGFELHVLRGLERTLASKPFIITELIESHLQRAGTSTAEVSAFLTDRGYTPYGIWSERKKRYLPEKLKLYPELSGDMTDVLWAAQALPAGLAACVTSGKLR